MLENRPIAQKSLAGVGAFMFVFAAAMAGTGVMISGGVPWPHHDASADMIGQPTASAPADWDFAESDLNRPTVHAVSYTPPQPERIDNMSIAAPAPSAPAPDDLNVSSSQSDSAFRGSDASNDGAQADDSADDTQMDSSDDPAKKN